MERIINFTNRSLTDILLSSQNLRNRYAQVKVQYKYYNGSHSGFFTVIR